MLTDNFKRKIDYLRVSVTDRCDLRCTYCMAEDVTFLPRQEVLSIEEIIKLIDIFNELGVKKFRLTGGEPLHHNLYPLCEAITTLVHEIMIQSYRYASYDIDITSMWGNVQRHGNHCFKHTHANSVFSGVFYLNEDSNFPPIQFHRPAESSFDIMTDDENEFNRGQMFLHPKRDMIVIFPSWLEHDVPVNTSGKDRLSISFNIMCRGRFGQKNSRQEVII